MLIMNGFLIQDNKNGASWDAKYFPVRKKKYVLDLFLLDSNSRIPFQSRNVKVRYFKNPTNVEKSSLKGWNLSEFFVIGAE